ncbi:MAG: hypothetical protein WA672_12515 [Candidatus Angelobacter sp.]
MPEEVLREEAPREDRNPDELLLALPDLAVSLLLEPLLVLELPVEPLFDLLLPDRAFAEDERAPDEREELLFLDLPLDFEGMGISLFCLFLCDEHLCVAGCQCVQQLLANILPLLCVAACAVWLDRSNDPTLKCRQAFWP